MNNLFKKSVAVIASMGVLATTVNVNAFAASLVNAEFTAAYEWMKESKATTMPTEEAFLPYNNVTREQAPKMMINGLMAGGVELKKVRDYNLDFSDLTSADPSLQADIIKGYEYGLVNGWNGEYHPRDVVNRAQVMTILGRALYGQLPESAEYWKNYYKLLNTEGIFTIENAQAPIKRYELALVLYRVANLDRTANNETVDQLLCEVLGKEDCKKDDKKDDTNNSSVTVDGSATVSRVSSIRTIEVPKNGVSQEAGTIKITAGKKGATISSVVIKRSGLGNAKGVESAQLVGNNMKTDARRFSQTSQTATVRFVPALQLSANESKEFKVLITFNGEDENGIHTFSADQVNVVDGTFDGTSVELNTLKTTSYEVSNVDVALTPGSVTNGKNNQSFARVRLTPRANATIKGFTLSKENGSTVDLDKAMSNAKVYYNNEVVGTVAVTNDKVVVSDLNIEKDTGKSAYFDLRADATYIGEATSFKFTMKDMDSVEAIEKSTNETMRLGGAENQQSVTVNLSSVNLTMTKKSSESLTVAPGNMVELLNAEIKSDAEFDVSKYSVKITSPAGNLDAFINKTIRLYINGEVTELKTGNNGNVTFSNGSGVVEFNSISDRFTVEPNRPVTVRVEGNLESTVNASTTYYVTFAIAQVRNINNGQESTISKSIAGNTVTIQDAKLQVKTATVAAPISRKVYTDGNNLEIGRFALRSEAEKVIVKAITLKNEATSEKVDQLQNIFSSIKLVNVSDNSEISADVEYDGTEIKFTNMNLAVEKKTDLNVKVIADTKSFNLADQNGKINIQLKVTIPENQATKESGGIVAQANITDGVLASSTDYNLAVRAPVIKNFKKENGVFTLTIVNDDADASMTINKLDIRIKGSASDLTSDYSGQYCLRPLGSAASTCTAEEGIVETTPASLEVKGDDTTFVLSTPVELASKGERSYEVIIDSAFTTPASLEAQLLKITYDTNKTENYDLIAK